ncbi:MAG TPA: hypothetical protein VGR45_16565 [Stellaceae bacterium]|nr:hypothetical protein [Stellaceae bacterium]
MSKASREKGLRREREIVARHIEAGIIAERVPLSGAQRYQGNGADVDVYAFGNDAAPLVTEVKARANGEGFTTIERWLSDADALFLVRDQELPGQPAPLPLVVLPWAVWIRLLDAIA